MHEGLQPAVGSGSDRRAARAIHIVGAGRLLAVEQPLPSADDRSSVVAPTYVGLCGTDVDLLEGTMAYFAQGLARYPLQPGHEWSGRVTETRDPGLQAGQQVIMDPIVGCGRCQRCADGRAAHCPDRWEIVVRNGLPGALATALAVPSANLVSVPAGVPLRDAVLVEPMVTVLGGLGRVRPRAGEAALVVGAGTLGLLATMILASRGLSVRVLARSRAREASVEEAGGTPVRSITPALKGRFEVVVEAAGSVEGVQAAFAGVAAGGRVALLGIPARPVELDIAALVIGDVSAHGILNGPGQFHAALECLASGSVRPDVVIDRVFDFDDVAAAFARASQSGRARPKVLVRMPDQAGGSGPIGAR
ncbi:alcohol dehydrogenase catalytic domain-containing protein [soil metagenome]